jgi:nucleoid-associated protein YgaU
MLKDMWDRLLIRLGFKTPPSPKHSEKLEVMTIHTVERDETISDLCLTYYNRNNSKLWDLIKQQNNLGSDYKIYYGQKLEIPKLPGT